MFNCSAIRHMKFKASTTTRRLAIFALVVAILLPFSLHSAVLGALSFTRPLDAQTEPLSDESRHIVNIQGLSGVKQFVDISLGEWRDFGVSQQSVGAALEAGLSQDYGCFGVTYLNSKLYTWGSERDERSAFPGSLFRSRRHHVLFSLRNVTQTLGNRIGSFEAVFCLGDCIVSQKFFHRVRHIGDVYPLYPDPLPIFSVVKCQGSMNIPYPFWDDATGPFSEWKSKIDNLTHGAKRIPWEERKSQAVFRGGQRTCVLYPKVGLQEDGRTFYLATPEYPEEAKRCGRTALIYQALSSPNSSLFNVSMTAGYPISYFGYNLHKGEDGPMLLTTEQHEDFRYIILAEGHCQWANRLRKHLFMGAALIMQVTQCIEPYGLGLEPWVHFIPVDYWFTNLTEAVVWGETHPEKNRQMIRRMHTYARKYVSEEGIMELTGQTMIEYARLMQFNVTLRDRVREVKEDCLQ